MLNANISMATLRPYISLIQKNGYIIDFQSIGEKYNLSEDYLTDRSKRLSIDILSELCEQVSRDLSDPLFGLKVGRLLALNKIEGFNDVMFVGRNVKDALETFERYIWVFSELGHTRLNHSDESCLLIFKPTKLSNVSALLVDAHMVFLYRFIHCLGGQGIRSLSLAQRCPDGLENQYQQAYPFPVYFNQLYTGFEIDPTWLEHHTSQFVEPNYNSIGLAEQQLSVSQGHADLPGQIQFILRRMLVTGEVSNKQVASALGLSVRTLQRRLRAKQLSYADLLENTRQELALEYLLNKSQSAEKISAFLGYSDLSCFLRAFKKWQGIGVKKYRAQSIDSPS